MALIDANIKSTQSSGSTSNLINAPVLGESQSIADLLLTFSNAQIASILVNAGRYQPVFAVNNVGKLSFSFAQMSVSTGDDTFGFDSFFVYDTAKTNQVNISSFTLYINGSPYSGQFQPKSSDSYRIEITKNDINKVSKLDFLP